MKKSKYLPYSISIYRRLILFIYKINLRNIIFIFKDNIQIYNINKKQLIFTYKRDRYKIPASYTI